MSDLSVRRLEEVRDEDVNEEGSQIISDSQKQEHRGLRGFSRRIWRSRSLTLPRRLALWVYSFSTIFLMCVTLAFAAVTPIDVIVLTSGASSWGVKMFIVIIVCFVSLGLGIILYFSRLIQHRLVLNDIPSKSVYIPFEGDMPRSCFQHIDKKLRECVANIRIRAGPLHNAAVINHPGLSPPEYVQERNISSNGEGTLLPPNSCYEDVIRSLGDKLRIDGKFMATIDVPPNFSFRELMILLSNMYINESNKSLEEVPDLKKTVRLYERFKFGPDLIKEIDLLSFMIEFDKLAQILQHSTGAVYDEEHLRNSYSQKGSFNNYSSNVYNDLDMLGETMMRRSYASNDNEQKYNESDFKHAPPRIEIDQSYNKSTDSMDSVINPKRYDGTEYPRRTSRLELPTFESPSRRMSTATSSSGRSVIKNRLALGSTFHIRKRSGRSGESVSRISSGYDTDTEEEYDNESRSIRGLRNYRFPQGSSSNNG